MAAKKTPAKKAAAPSKSAPSAAATSNTMPYGVPIYNAIKSGDKVQMKQLLGEAKKHLANHEKLQTAVAKLEAALKKS